ncbi:hypothetical protein P5V15_008288 [Pogonomyrmex californicus]
MYRVNKYFNQLARDPLLYPNFTEDDALEYTRSRNSREHLLKLLQSKYKYARKLTLHFFDFNTTEICDLLESHGNFLTHLSLLQPLCFTTNLIVQISRKCKNLKELIFLEWETEHGYSHLANLQFLENLYLPGSSITTSTLCKIIQANSRLRRLSIEGCREKIDLGEVSAELRKNCPNLEEVNFHLCNTDSTSRYFVELSGCKNLRVIDFTGHGVNFRNFLSSCQYLEIVFLRDLKGLTNDDLKTLTSCKNLKYLDLIGVQDLTADTCHTFLKCCPKLNFILFSSSHEISDCLIAQWKEMYSHVTIIKCLILNQFDQ